ncbi:FliG C-terminal domain-containing protein [uncultured Thioclava sp.]|jgi:flagellar motor switch protein FliG|uniref:flagellar motor switch protein FliG n=1 Tax=uncultured Thioclava sp. TaxID=473858 RepID=UPI0025CF8319|nr:FliG C-terminal domain-containing protein [uncultured Thioclava sp.]
MIEPDSGMSGAAMAAYVVMSMDEEAATQVLRHMDEASIGILTAAMSEMHEPSRDEGVQIYARLMAELEAGGAIASGGFDAFESLLSRAFGDKRAHDMLERIIRTRTSDLDILSKIDGRTLADQVKDERPQLLAVLLGQMTRSAAVECLNAFDEELATDLIHRYARLETIPSVALAELKSMLSDHLGTQIATQASSTGGVRQAADLLNGMSAGAAERALSRIREEDADLADRIRANMFTFDDLLGLPDHFLQQVIFEVGPERRSPALRSATEQTRERFFANISRKDAAILKDDIENGPMVKRADSQAAQHEFVEAAMRLSREGRISLSNEEDMV